MQTLADLKRKLSIGTALKLISFKGCLNVNSKNLNVVRYVVKTQGNGVYLNADKTQTKGSFFELPKSSLLEYHENLIKIFLPIERDLTPEEIKIIDNEPKDAEQDKIDIMTDGSQMFYRRKNYYKESGFYYLFGVSEDKGKYLTQKNGLKAIRDDSLKGELDRVYEIV